MNNDKVFYTKTMAKVHADQGNLEKAAEIYKYLIKKDPGRQDLMDALADIEKKRFEKDPSGLGDLFSTWIDLLFVQEQVRKLKKLKNLKKM